MNYRTIRLDFREVARADTFGITLAIDPAYPITPTTRILMHVKPVGDIPEQPILVFDSAAGTITIDGQDITLAQSAATMDVRPGCYTHDIRFITAGQSTTLYQGLFEITPTATPLPQ
jgi:hypothetical protein